MTDEKKERRYFCDECGEPVDKEDYIDGPNGKVHVCGKCEYRVGREIYEAARERADEDRYERYR
jgi:hypothetical protein